MPRRNAVEQLPSAVKGWLDKALVDGNFSGYEALAEELRTRGYAMSKSSLHRYGQAFEDNLAKFKLATEQAKAFAESVPDDAGYMGDTLTRLVQQKAFDALMNMSVDPEAIKFTDMGKMIADLNKASIAQKKWMTEIRHKAEAAAQEVEKVARAGGLSEEAVVDIRTKILGIA